MISARSPIEISLPDPTFSVWPTAPLAVAAREREAVQAQIEQDGSGATPPPHVLRRALERRLAVMPDRLREVLVLRYYHDLSEREIAAIAGVPQGTVKSRLHAAIRALRTETGRDD